MIYGQCLKDLLRKNLAPPQKRKLKKKLKKEKMHKIKHIESITPKNVNNPILMMP